MKNFLLAILDCCRTPTTTGRRNRFLRPFSSKRHPLGCRADDCCGNFETENQVFLRKAQTQSAKQVFKDFVFSINDSYGAEADKILQMGQNLQPMQEFLTQIGAWQWYVKAAQSAQNVRYLLGERAKTKGETVKGELKSARRATDLAVADLYKTINAMMDLMPSDALTALYTQLKGFERYAKQYYLSKGKDEDEPEPDPQPEPDVTPVQPE